MEIKKSSKADLEVNRSIYVLTGLVMALAFMYIAFEWTETEVLKFETPRDLYDMVEFDLIHQAVVPPPDIPPPQPPPATTAVVRENLHIVADTVKTTAVLTVTEEMDNMPVVLPPDTATTTENPEEVVYISVEELPSFPGGDKARIDFISSIIKYPAVAQDAGIQGIVYVSFIVNRDGKIVDIQVPRGIHEILDNEAVRVIQLMPPWNPGKQHGKPVRTKIFLPVSFNLQNKS